MSRVLEYKKIRKIVNPIMVMALVMGLLLPPYGNLVFAQSSLRGKATSRTEGPRKDLEGDLAGGEKPLLRPSPNLPRTKASSAGAIADEKYIKDCGLDVIGGVKNRWLGERLIYLTGINALGHSPEVYSPLNDPGHKETISLEFASTAAKQIKELAIKFKLQNKDSIKILVIGSGTGIDAICAFHHAKFVEQFKSVKVDAIDIQGDAVENTKFNFIIRFPDSTFRGDRLQFAGEGFKNDRVIVRQVEEGKEFDGLEGAYDLILFNAPDAVMPDRIYDTTVHMDQFDFKAILENIKASLADEGVALIRNLRNILDAEPNQGRDTRLIPDGFNVTYATPSGIFLRPSDWAIFKLTLDQTRHKGWPLNLDYANSTKVPSAGKDVEIAELAGVDKNKKAIELKPGKSTDINYPESGPVCIRLAPETEGELKLGVYRYEDLPAKAIELVNIDVGYFIIDEEIDRLGSYSGYKGLRDGEIVEIGRGIPGRFELTKYISRKHVSIKREGDVITIVADINSEYPTKIDSIDIQKRRIAEKELEERIVEEVNKKIEEIGGIELFKKPFKKVAKVLGAKEMTPTREAKRLFALPTTPACIYISEEGWEGIIRKRAKEILKPPETWSQPWIYAPGIDGPGVYYCKAVIDKKKEEGYKIDSVAFYHEMLEAAFYKEGAFDKFCGLSADSHCNLRVVEETLRLALKIGKESFDNNWKNLKYGMENIIKKARQKHYPDELIQEFEKRHMEIYNKVKQEQGDTEMKSSSAGDKLSYIEKISCIKKYLDGFLSRVEREEELLEKIGKGPGVEGVIADATERLKKAEIKLEEAKVRINELSRRTKEKSIPGFVEALKKISDGAVKKLSHRQKLALLFLKEVMESSPYIEFESADILFIPKSSWLSDMFDFQGAGKFIRISDGKDSTEIGLIRAEGESLAKGIKTIFHESFHEWFGRGIPVAKKKYPEEVASLYYILEEAKTESAAIGIFESFKKTDLGYFLFEEIPKKGVYDREPEEEYYLYERELLRVMKEKFGKEQTEKSIKEFLVKGNPGPLKELLGHLWEKFISITSKVDIQSQNLVYDTALRVMFLYLPLPDAEAKLEAGILFLDALNEMDFEGVDECKEKAVIKVMKDILKAERIDLERMTKADFKDRLYHTIEDMKLPTKPTQKVERLKKVADVIGQAA